MKQGDRTRGRRSRGLLVAGLTPLLLVVLAVCDASPADTAGTGDPEAVMVVGGEDQVGLTRVPLPDSLAVRVVDADGRAVEGVTVEWSSRRGGSGLPRRSTTDADGVARTLWVPGLEPGVDTVRARTGGLDAELVVDLRTAEPGVAYTGRAGYVTYEPGELPLVLSAGHGGTLEPAEIPDRTEGTMVRDVNTDLLARAMADSLEARLGARPHLVVLHIHRRKLDANRELAEAAQGNRLAEHTWREYHALIEHAGARVEAEHGAGFYIDVHGHGHPIDRLELGYLLTDDDLALPPDALAALAGESSIRALAAASDLSFDQLIRGDTSLGTLYEDAGVPAVPSAQQPDPGDDPFFSGGYSTRRHGSRDGGSVSGVQIEAHRPGLRDTAANRARFAGISARILETYLAAHYGFAPATLP